MAARSVCLHGQACLHGRRKIFTDTEVITERNVLAVLKKALPVHARNRAEICYLYDYYRGVQPVLERTKQVRPEICNRVVENRAAEIVSFKVGYLMGEPVQYVFRGSATSPENQQITEELNLLNEYVFAEDKAAGDKELADWFTICGTAYRMIRPDPDGQEDESPFEIYTLDPRNTFVVYHSGLGNRPVMGVTSVMLEDGDVVHCVYTKYRYFEIIDDRMRKSEAHLLGGIPIIEYPAGEARMGAFEPVLPLLDAINTVTSDRLDGVEQFIQALLMFKGVDIESEDFDALKEKGGIRVPADGDVKYLIQELNQTGTQTLMDHLYGTVLTIVGMPNRNGGSSTSDTGSAVILRDGWAGAETRAKETELVFKRSEKEFLRLALSIMGTLRGTHLRLPSIEIRFTRRNYENIQEKAQVLTTMLSCEQIHPRLAFAHCGMFADPELAYTMSMEYAKDREEDTVRAMEAYAMQEADANAG